MAKEEIIILKLALDAEATIKTTDDLIARNKTLAKLLKSAPREGEEGFDELSESIDRTRQEYAQNREEINKFNRSLRETDQASDSMVGLSRQLRELEKEYKSLTKEQRKAFGAELGANIKSTREELRGLEGELGDYRRGVGDYPEAQGGFFSLGNVIKGVGVAAAASLTMDAAIEGAKKVAEITKEFKQLRGEIQTFTGATGNELDDFTVKVSAISKTFGKENDEILLAANSLSKNLNVDFNESLSLIEKGLLAGADANGEFLDSLTEYPATLANVGLSAEQVINLITEGATGGVFSDKLIDSIKEADLSLKELTKTQLDALAPLGETFVDELSEGIKKGEISTIEAVRSIGEQSDKLGLDVSQLQTITADVFKGAGEDAGGFGKVLEATLSATNKSIDDYIDLTNEATRSQIIQLKSEKQLSEAKNETSKRFSSLTDGTGVLSNALQTLLFTYLNAVFDALSPIGDALTKVGGTMASFAKRIGIVSDQGEFFQFVVNQMTLGLRLVGFIIEKQIENFGFLVEALIYLYDNFEPLRKIVDFAAVGFRNLQLIIGNLPATFSAVRVSLEQLGINIVDWYSTTLINAKIFAKEIDKAFTIRQSARDRINAEIEGLKADKSKIAEAGRTVGEAFREEFERSIAELDATAAVSKSDATAPAAEAGSKAGESFQKAFDGEVDGTNAAEVLADSIPKTLDKVLKEGSVEALREKVSELEELLDSGLVPGSEKYLVVAGKIKEANEKLAEAEEARRILLLSDDEIIKAKAEQAKKIAEDAKKEADEKLANTRNEISLELAVRKRAAQVLRDEQLSNDKLTAEQRKVILDAYNAEIQAADIEAERSRLLLLEEGSVQRLQLEQSIADAELAIRGEFYASELEQAEAAEEEKQALREQFQELAMESAQLIADGAFEIASINLENETEAKLAKLDEETEAKLLSAAGSEEEQVRIKAEAEAKKEEIEKAAAKKRQKQAILQAIINGALGAVQALANTALPFPLSLTALIPVALTTALNIATIKKQKFERGKGSVAPGKLHTQGGTPARIYGEGGKTEEVEIEADEIILNRISSSRYYQTASDINQDGGGIRFPGTKPLDSERRNRLRLMEGMSAERPILAARGLSPRIPSLRTKKRKFVDGAVASVTGSNVLTSGLSKEDAKIIANAAEQGTRKGIENANLFDKFKRQQEREQDSADASEV